MKIKDISEALNKETKLRRWMRKQSVVLVAYSGGVDSSYLGLIATQELGESAICVTGVSPSVSEHQLKMAKRIAVANRFNHELLNTEEMLDPNYRKNAGDRCYFCKSELYSRLAGFRKGPFKDAEIIDGSNADDEKDYRPGKQAAIENGVGSPLADFGFTKSHIRQLSFRYGLETWDKPASPCLSSRIAVGVPVTIERLSLVEKGEDVLRKLGFKEFRVRVHGEIARIEISADEMDGSGFLSEIREASSEIKALGFKFVALELDGFRSGSLNELPGINQH